MMILGIVLTIVCLDTVACVLETPLEYDFDKPDHKFVTLKSCIQDILHKISLFEPIILFENKRLTEDSIFDSDFLLSLTSKLATISILKYNLEAENQDSLRSYVKGSELYLLEFENLTDLEYTINVTRKQEHWSCETRFIVCARKFRKYNSKLLSDISKALAGKDILNFILLIPTKESLTELKIYIWFRKFEGNCKMIKGNSEEIGYYSRSVLTLHQDEIFHNRIPERFNKCIFKASVKIAEPFTNRPMENYLDHPRFTGVDIDLINQISEILDINFEFILSVSKTWGDFHENGTCFGDTVNLVNEDVDLLLGSYLVSLGRVRNIDVTASYYFQPITWCVPRARRIPEWKLMFHAFMFSTLIAAVVLLCIVAIFVYISYSVDYTKCKTPSLHYWFLNIYGATLGYNILIMPKNLSSKLVVMLYIFYSLLATKYYTSQLSSVMTSSIFEPQVQTVHDMLAKQLELHGTVSLTRFLVDQENLKEVLIKQQDTFPGNAKLVEEIAHGKQEAFITIKFTVEYLAQEYMDEDGRPLVYCFKDSLAVTHTAFMLRRNSFVTPRINKVILQLSAAGFIDHWMKTMLDRHGSGIKKKFNKSQRVTTMTTLQVVFYLLFSGLVLAVIAFLIEVLLYKRNND